MRETYNEEDLTMKKFFATIITLCFILTISYSTAYALTPGDLVSPDADQNRVLVSEVYKSSDFYSFDYVVNTLEHFARKELNNGNNVTWASVSLNNQQDLQFYVFYKKNSEKYEELLDRIDCDFIQVGSLLDVSVLEKTEKEFKNDPLKAALNAIIPSESSIDKEKIYEQLKSKNIPIYWEIKGNDSKVFTLEVAISKYVVQKGDTLSEIACFYNTSVKDLLENNSNITNPDLIYAGDFLVIK